MTLTACVHYDIEVMRSMDNRIIQLHFHPQSTLEISSKLVHTYQKSDTQRKKVFKVKRKLIQEKLR